LTENIARHEYSDVFKRHYWNFMVRGGVGFQKGKIYKDDNISFTLKPAEVFQFGWMINFALPKRFSVQTGVNFEIGYERFRYYIRENFYKENIVLNNPNDDRHFHYRSLVIPLYFCYRIPIPNKATPFFFEPKIVVDIKYMGAGFVIVNDILQSLNRNDSYPAIHLEQGTKSSYAGGKRDVLSASLVVGLGFNFFSKNREL
jgi:hypothetical protein